jgi:hypothetical protein
MNSITKAIKIIINSKLKWNWDSDENLSSIKGNGEKFFN